MPTWELSFENMLTMKPALRASLWATFCRAAPRWAQATKLKLHKSDTDLKIWSKYTEHTVGTSTRKSGTEYTMLLLDQP